MGPTKLLLAQPLFTLLPAERTGVYFKNPVLELEKDSLSINFLINPNFMTGGGVAIGDINNDGLQDIFFTANRVSSRLYLNKGNMVFEDITEKAGVTTKGWCTGVTFVDVNLDGFLDIYVCRSSVFEDHNRPDARANLLFINNGNLTFTEKAAAYGINDKGYSIHANFFDYDKDGDLDVYVLNQPLLTKDIYKQQISLAGASRIATIGPDMLYQNQGNNKFINVSKIARITEDNGSGLSVTVGDIDKDGWQDIFVANDFLQQDFLYINQRNGTFDDRSEDYLKHFSLFSMGSDLGDINNDGYPELFVADMMPESNLKQKLWHAGLSEHYYEYTYGGGKLVSQFVKNSLYLNTGKENFPDIAYLAGVAHTDWSWSALFADFDNDGYKDLYVTNGIPRETNNRDILTEYAIAYAKNPRRYIDAMVSINFFPPYRVPNYCYQNNKDLTFTNRALEWGLAQPLNSYGAAYGDLDNDGDLDLVVNNLDTLATIYQNNAVELNKRNYIRIQPVGKIISGVKATIYYQGKLQYHEISNTRGYESCSEQIFHFGLDTVKQIDSLEIWWPDNKRELIIRPPINTQVQVFHENATAYQLPLPSKPLYFENTREKVKIQFKHQENDFRDFSYERLLHHRISRKGPGVAVGDVNGDGLDDFYVGGAAGQAGKLFLQNANATFSLAPSQPFAADAASEDLGCLFLDVDKDGDLDLIVISGGNEFITQKQFLLDRLYVNDGKGNFTKAKGQLPEMYTSKSCIAACDFDADGDEDLFIGGRVVPGRYPTIPRSFLLMNDNGRFLDVTAVLAPDLKFPGMITAATWSDLNNDGYAELIAVGEWTPIMIFVFTNGEFKRYDIPYTHGWWNSITAADLNNDGLMDLVAGNQGWNSRFRASFNEPVMLYAYDFDHNGSLDPVLFHYQEGKKVPAPPRDLLTEQLPYLKNKFITYHSYGMATDTTIFPKDTIAKAYQLKAETFSSCIFLNQGNSQFAMIELPQAAQLGPVYGIVSEDFNQDGKQDLLLVGNCYGTYQEYSRDDGLNGLLLLGDNTGKFTPVSIREGGFYTPLDAKALAKIHLSQTQAPSLIVSNNNGPLQFYTSLVPFAEVISTPKGAYSAQLTFTDGSIRKVEFYKGNGYLSGHTQHFFVPKNVTRIDFFDSRAKFLETKTFEVQP
ncbi:MAG: VCBS repeat-containing protein [Bacteroidia bacterium]|nr:VCBS repeat-containing protein [Bacteroidia bacterium]MDW8158352.1 VCBS repeat-containing protein [Bacteroidia bacterium]